MNWELAGNEVRIGRHFTVSFQRTLRVPEAEQSYPLPPGLGRLPISRVRDHAGAVPPEWLDQDGLFIPLYQHEALWLAFGGPWWRPSAIQVGVGGINAVSGTAWDQGLNHHPQNYLVTPHQPWLDGINSGDGHVRQFVAAALGRGVTVEGQLTGAEEHGGIQLRVYQPLPGRFPEEAPAEDEVSPEQVVPMAASVSMGLGAGGLIRQKIYPDPHGIEAWDPESASCVFVHILNSRQYQRVTGRPAPPTPVSAATYAEHGLPWFDLYDEDRSDVSASSALSAVQPVGQRAGSPKAPGPFNPDPASVKKLHPPPKAPEGGD